MAWVNVVRKILLTTRLQGGNDSAVLNQPIKDLEDRTDDLHARTLALEPHSVWHSAVHPGGTNIKFLALPCPSGQLRIWEIAVYWYAPGDASAVVVHVASGPNNSVSVVPVSALHSSAFSVTAERVGSTIEVGLSGFYAGDAIRALARQIAP